MVLGWYLLLDCFLLSLNCLDPCEVRVVAELCTARAGSSARNFLTVWLLVKRTRSAGVVLVVLGAAGRAHEKKGSCRAGVLLDPLVSRLKLLFRQFDKRFIVGVAEAVVLIGIVLVVPIVSIVGAIRRCWK